MYEAIATGDLAPSQRETRGARWPCPHQAEVIELRARVAELQRRVDVLDRLAGLHQQIGDLPAAVTCPPR